MQNGKAMAHHTSSSPTTPTVPASGILLVIGSCCSLQLGASLAMQLFPFAGPWATTALRLLLAAVVLCAITRPKVHRYSWQQWKAVILFGISLGGMNATFYASLQTLPLGPAVTIEFMGPLLLAAVLSKTSRDLMWVGCAACGMALLGYESLTREDGALDPRGVLFVSAAGAFWIMYVLCSSKVGSLVPGTGGLGMALVVGGLAILPLGVTEVPHVLTDAKLLALAFGTAMLASLLPYTFELIALRQIPSGVFGILLSLEPVFATFFGWLFLGQHITALRMAAVVLVIAASIGTTINANRRTRTRRSTECTEP